MRLHPGRWSGGWKVRETMKNAYRALVNHHLRYNELVTDSFEVAAVLLDDWGKPAATSVV